MKNTQRIGILFLLITLLGGQAKAQFDRPHVVSFVGHGNVFGTYKLGFMYDQRFKKELSSGFGYSVSTFFRYYHNYEDRIIGDLFNDRGLEYISRGVTVPFNLNYVLGKKRFKFMVGAGPELMGLHVKKYWPEKEPTSHPQISKNVYYSSSKNYLTVALNFEVGLRVLFKNGVFMMYSYNYNYPLKHRHSIYIDAIDGMSVAMGIGFAF